jgi:hypothetical protein
MQIETIDHFQLHLIAHEVSGNKWDPFVAVYKFDDEIQDFVCIYEKHRAAAEPLASYDEAIEAARRAGNTLLEQARP